MQLKRSPLRAPWRRRPRMHAHSPDGELRLQEQVTARSAPRDAGWMETSGWKERGLLAGGPVERLPTAAVAARSRGSSSLVPALLIVGSSPRDGHRCTVAADTLLMYTASWIMVVNGLVLATCGRAPRGESAAICRRATWRVQGARCNRH